MIFAILAFLIEDPPPPSTGDELAWFERVNWNGLVILASFLFVALLIFRRIARRFRRREKDSLELATWAQSGFFKTSRIFRKYGRSTKQGRLSRLATKMVAKRINRKHSKYQDEFKHLRTRRLDEEIE